MASSTDRSFKVETTKAILKHFFRGDKTKLMEEAGQLVAEVASLAVVEATLRAGKQAKTEGSTVIQAEHVEKVLPQLITDL
ncbi:centromere protein X-like [Macrosteles quadrilineatus]|uniref:centromere protein X-like n=1 Tax=Macrosteles quadrilineatus TaxID=74068 RepID=UPI0023E25EFB|nr:centromere protein X-like [Macrosteles quadrilineatus]XP_054278752.1 centromere protein X-like [Macrosteles quadrilineatus]XP_054278753.1 centromere protein X-like [Macrosteles quadrilineatus]XP_054278852.1 centromere protein X-like [Macrosteles quadrilineatus]XP_054278853.1 centromere protein X-like [Macrosteles quadrilineatus]XP_054278854.1 centromere protein X-like [Macrosteles quadrilineatus]XP_054278855.1 centromere protein X-like [Macrosteles quadrilineatus]